METPQARLEGTTESNLDQVNHPKHYTFSAIEVIDAIEAWGLDYHLGNAIKYIVRAKHKGKFEEDIRKAIWYLKRRIEAV